MSSYKVLFPYIQPYVPGCSIPMIEQQIGRVVRDFCQRTRAWKHDCDDIVLAEGVNRYDLAFPEAAELVQVEYASWNNTPITERTHKQIERNVYGWKTQTAQVPCHYIPLANNLIEFWPIPASGNLDYPVSICVSLKPTIKSTGMENTNLIEEYAEMLADGVLAHLTGMPRKEWSDPSYSQMYSQNYETAMSKAIIRERDSRTVTKRVVKYGGL